MSQLPQTGAFTQYNSELLLQNDPFLHSASTQTTINQHRSGRRYLTYDGVLAIVLAAPDSGADDGVQIRFISTVSRAHTVTATGLLKTGSANVNVATFAAFPGAGFTIEAYQGKWYVTSQIGITFS